MQWVLIDRVGHLAYYILTKISGLNQSNTDSQEARHFSTVKVVDQTIDPGPVAVSGWTADGWREDGIAAAHTIEPTGTVTMAGDITIYAVYRRNATFYSGVNMASSATATQYYNTTNKYSLLTLPSTSAAAITDYIPIKWVSAGGNDVDFNARYTDSGSVFYAKYTRPVTFYSGVNKASSTTATQTYISDNHYSLTAPAISQAASLGNGWSAVDWLQTDDNVHLAESGTYTGSRSVFYAHYSRGISINYSANGGTGTTSPTTGTSYYNSSNVITSNQLTLASNGFSRTGYSFNGWDLGAIGENVTFAVGDAASKTAKAQWAGYTYSVTYKQGSATTGWDASTYAKQSATYPAEITLRTNNMGKSDTEKANSRFTITYDANGGSVGTTSNYSYIPIGYTKNGWTTTSTSTTRVYTDGYKYTDTSSNGSNIDLYPCFTQSDKTRTTITTPTPTRTNMTCTGWFDGTGSTAQKVYSCGLTYTPSKTQKVYAQWTNADKNMTFQNVVAQYYTNSNTADVQTYRKTVYNVTFGFKAGMTWQNMVDSDTYKWPTSFTGKRGSNGNYNASFSYTSRSAVQAGDSYAYLRCTNRSGNNFQANVDGYKNPYVWFEGNLMDHVAMYNPSQRQTQFITTGTRQGTFSGAAGYASNEPFPMDVILGSAIVNVGTTYYISSGDNTGVGNQSECRTLGNFVFRTQV